MWGATSSAIMASWPLTGRARVATGPGRKRPHGPPVGSMRLTTEGLRVDDGASPRWQRGHVGGTPGSAVPLYHRRGGATVEASSSRDGSHSHSAQRLAERSFRGGTIASTPRDGPVAGRGLVTVIVAALCWPSSTAFLSLCSPTVHPLHPARVSPVSPHAPSLWLPLLPPALSSLHPPLSPPTSLYHPSFPCPHSPAASHHGPPLVVVADRCGLSPSPPSGRVCVPRGGRAARRLGDSWQAPSGGRYRPRCGGHGAP